MSLVPGTAAEEVKMLQLFGASLRRIRKAREHTQASLGLAVGVDRLTIHNWEAGKHQPNLENLLALQRALGLGSVELLFSGETDFDSRTLANMT